jgi:hypothetical protein
LTRSNAFFQSMKQAHNSSSMTKVRSDILSIPIASLDRNISLQNFIKYVKRKQ